MVYQHMLTLVLNHFLSNEDQIASLRSNPDLVTRIDQLYLLLHVKVDEGLLLDMQIPTTLLSQESLIMYYQCWGLHQTIIASLAAAYIQPAALLDLPIEALHLSGIGGIRKIELEKTIKMIKIIIGMDHFVGMKIPTEEYYANCQSVRNILDRTYSYLQEIGFPWIEAMHVVGDIKGGNFKPDNIIGIPESEIAGRKTWRNVATRLRILKLYLETIKKAYS